MKFNTTGYEFSIYGNSHASQLFDGLCGIAASFNTEIWHSFSFILIAALICCFHVQDQHAGNAYCSMCRMSVSKLRNC